MLVLTLPACRPTSWWRPLTSMFHSMDSHNMLKWCVRTDAVHTHIQTLTCIQTHSIGFPTLQSAFTREKTNASAPPRLPSHTAPHVSLHITSCNGLCADDHGEEVLLMKPQLSKETLIDVFISLTECCNVCSPASPPLSLPNALPPAVMV